MDKKHHIKVTRALYQRITFHNRLASLVASEIMYIISSRGDDRNHSVLRTLKTFNDIDSDSDWKSSKRQIKDYLYSRCYYLVKEKEYFLYGIDRSKNAEKLNYVGWYELKEYYDELNNLGRPEIFEKKELTYERFKAFFNREQLFVSSEEGQWSVFAFLERHPDCIFKPTDEYGGHGIEFLHSSDDHPPEAVWEEIKNRCPFVLEELIHQSSEMNVFYPHSVNTIRYNTFFHDDKLTRMQAVFRIGRGGSIVDNATSGGIYALVDTETGRILCPARSFRNELFEQHPDTGTQLEGNYIPRWDELNALLEKAVRVVPEQKQVGWDFALSTDGWVMVEGNTTPALQSFDLNHGLRDLITDTFGQVVTMYK